MAPYIHADEVGTGNNIVVISLIMDIIKKTPLLLIKNPNMVYLVQLHLKFMPIMKQLMMPQIKKKCFSIHLKPKKMKI